MFSDFDLEYITGRPNHGCVNAILGTHYILFQSSGTSDHHHLSMFSFKSSEAISAAKRSLHGPRSATWHPRSMNVTSAGSSLPTLGRPPTASPRCVGTTAADVPGSCAELGAWPRNRAYGRELSGVCVRVLKYKCVYMDYHQR